MNSSHAFPVDLVIRAIRPEACKGKQTYLLESDFVYNSSAFGSITVPAGLPTDFASIPRIAYAYLSPEDPQILWPAVVHDYLYSVHGHLPLRTLTRAECDTVLCEAMRVCNARPTQAALVHRMVRLFGGSHW